MDQVLSQNDQSTSQTFTHIRLVYLSSNPSFSQARLTGLFHLASLPATILTSMVLVYAFPQSNSQSGTRESRGRGFFILSIRTYPCYRVGWGRLPGL